MKYVSYYRVSTQKQGNSGLGLDAQKSAVINYLKGDIPIEEFVDIESGTKKGNDRKGLKEALNYCKEHKAKLIIAKLDRLSRNVSFISQIMESDVEFIVTDLPQANRFTIQIFAALAEQEARFISERTRVALQELKKRGVKLGKPENLNEEARKKGLKARIEKAKLNENNRKATILILNLREQGYNFNQIAIKLNTYGYKTSTNLEFSRVQVRRLFINAREK